MTDQETHLTEVTDEQWAIIRPDLEKLLKTEQKKSELIQYYALRLALAASDSSKVSDEAWETLEDITTRWVNGATLANEKKEPIPLPPSVMAAISEKAEEPEAETQTEDEKAPAPPEKKEAAKAPKAAKKPAAPAKAASETAAPKKAAPAKAKAPAPKKAVAKKASAKTENRGRPTLFQDTDVISIKSKEPFRAGTISAIGFAKIKDGMTVSAAIAAGTPRRLIRWASICEYIKIKPAPKKAA